MQVEQYVPPLGCRAIQSPLTALEREQLQELQGEQLNDLHQIMSRINKLQRLSREFFPPNLQKEFQELLTQHGDLNQLITQIIRVKIFSFSAIQLKRRDWLLLYRSLDASLGDAEKQVFRGMNQDIEYLHSLFRTDLQTLNNYQGIHHHLQEKYHLEKQDRIQEWHQETIMIQETHRELAQRTVKSDFFVELQQQIIDWVELLRRTSTQIEKHVQLMTHYRQAEIALQKGTPPAPPAEDIPAEVMAFQVQEWGGEMTEWGMIRGIDDLM